MLFFSCVIGFVVVQRLIELMIANRNAEWIRARGGYEVGKGHYKYIVMLHIGFFLSLVGEVVIFQREMAVWWWLPFLLFLVAQFGRIWSLTSLGPFWNTRIMILPGAKVIAKGPYRYMKHPNYFIVVLELITLPLIFQAYGTLVLFTLLKFMLLAIRIPQEEKALSEVTNYEETFANHRRFLPKYDIEE